jgi:hypothetical protein
VCRTALFMTVQEHYIAYCRCREAVKLFRFLLSPYSLIRFHLQGYVFGGELDTRYVALAMGRKLEVTP